MKTRNLLLAGTIVAGPLLSLAIPNVAAVAQTSPAMRLAVTAAAFGEWLSRSPYAGEITPSALQPYLNSVCETYSPDTRPQRLANMIRQAQAIGGK